MTRIQGQYYFQDLIKLTNANGIKFYPLKYQLSWGKVCVSLDKQSHSLVVWTWETETFPYQLKRGMPKKVNQLLFKKREVTEMHTFKLFCFFLKTTQILTPADKRPPGCSPSTCKSKAEPAAAGQQGCTGWRELEGMWGWPSGKAATGVQTTVSCNK